MMEQNQSITDAMMAEWGLPQSEVHQQSSSSTNSNNNNTNTSSSSPFSQNLADLPPDSIEPPQPQLEQHGAVILGQGSQKEAIILGLGLPRLTHRQYDDLAKAKKYAMEQSIKHVLMKQTISHQQQQQKVAMYSQALSLMSRVYVGSISFELKEEMIKTAFSPFGPIKSVNMSYDPVTGHHKGFAFLEFELAEAAQLAQDQMNGILIGGRNIKAKPPECRVRAQPIIDMIASEARQFNRVYVSSIHQDLTENDIKSVFEAFGVIRTIDLAKAPGPGGKHKGYAFIEYETEQAAIEAVASMNMFDLGGQHLRVGRAITPPQAKEYVAPSANSTLPTAAAVAAAAVTAKIQAMDPILGTNTMSPQIVIANTSSSPQPTQSILSTFAQQSSRLGPQIFTVPPPGVAIPQIPQHLATAAAGTTPPGMVMAPRLHSMPHGSPSGSLNSGGSPSIGVGHQGNSPSINNNSANQFSHQLTPPSAPSGFGQPPPSVAAIPPPGVMLQPPVLASQSQQIASSTTGSIGQQNSSGQAQQQQLNAAAAAAAQASQRLSSSMSASGLNDKQKQILEMEGTQTIASQEDMKIKGNEARNILMHKLMRRTESCILVLKNMVSPEEVDETLQGEVAEECSKYGQVDQVVIYQEEGENPNAPGMVKIFVKYSMVQEADAAKNALDGRYFAGRQLKAQIYDQNLFDHHDLTG